MKHPVKRVKPTITLARLVPNVVTLLALCSGLMALRFALDEGWTKAVAFIALAAFLDNLDGRMARLLSGGTRFGVELDSLADFFSFSLSPALIIYLWSDQGNSAIVWMAVMIYIVCGALRLARFNALADDQSPPEFFTGLSAPAASGCALLPMIVSFQWGWDFLDQPWLVASVLVMTGLLMVSSIPSWSLKNIRFSSRLRLPILTVAALSVVLLVNFFWLGLMLIIVGYMTSIPFAIYNQSHGK